MFSFTTQIFWDHKLLGHIPLPLVTRHDPTRCRIAFEFNKYLFDSDISP